MLWTDGNGRDEMGKGGGNNKKNSDRKQNKNNVEREREWRQSEKESFGNTCPFTLSYRVLAITRCIATIYIYQALCS